MNSAFHIKMDKMDWGGGALVVWQLKLTAAFSLLLVGAGRGHLLALSPDSSYHIHAVSCPAANSRILVL